MERYAVIGYPVTHSLSPVIHAGFAAQTGKEIHYEQLNVPAVDFEAAVRDFRQAGGCGLNVTVPHKEAALELAGEIMPQARMAGLQGGCRRCRQYGWQRPGLRPDRGTRP